MHNPLARNTPLARCQAALADLRDEIVPLEPRVLLDATLDLDPGGAGVDMLHAIAGSLDGQRRELGDIFDEFQTGLAESLGAVGGMLDPSGSDPDSGLEGAGRGATALMADLRTALFSASAAFEANLEAFVADEAATLRTQINNGLLSELGIGNLLGAEDGDLEALLRITPLASAERFEDAVEDRLETRLTDALGQPADADDLATLFDVIASEVGAAAEANRADLFSLDFADRADGEGQPVVTYDDRSAAGISRTGVTVTPPSMILDLGSWIADAGFGLDIQGTDLFVLDLSAFSFGFEIEAEQAGDQFTLAHDDFSLPDFTFGGQIFTAGANQAAVDLGLLDAALEEVELATFELAVGGLSSIDLESTFDFSDRALLTDFDHDPLSADLMIRPVGSGSFSPVVNDEAYRLLRLQVDGDLAFVDKTTPLLASDYAEGARIERAYGLDLVVSGLVRTDGPSLAEALRASLAIDLDVDLSGLGLTPEQEVTFEDLVTSVVTIGGEDVATMLSTLADNMSALFASAVFDFTLPFTDLTMRDAFAEISDAVEGIAAAFEIDLEALGLASTALLNPARLASTGAPADLERFDDVSSFLLVMPTAEGDLEIEVLSPHDGGGFATLDELADALNDGLAGATLNGEPFEINAEAEADGAAFTFAMTDPAGPGVALILPADPVLPSALEALGFSNGIALGQAVTGFDFGPLDLSVLEGVEQLTFTLVEDDRSRKITVASTSDQGGFADLADFVDALNAALEGSNAIAAVNGAGDGVALAMVDPDGAAVQLGIRPTDALAAQSLDGLIAWANAQLDDQLPGSGIALDAAGRLQFLLPSLGGSVDVDAGTVSFADLAFDLIGSIDLSTAVSGTVEAFLDATLVFDLGGFASAFTGGAAGNLTARANGTPQKDLEASLLDHVLLDDFEVFGRIAAAATSIEGEASLGLVSAVFGEDDPAANQIAVDLQLQATLVGADDTVFLSSASLGHIAERIEANRTRELLGRFEIQGGLISDDEGQPLFDGGGLVQVANVFENPPDEGMAHVAVVLLDDVSIRAAGLDGLGADAINGLAIAIPDLFNPDNFIVTVDSPFAAALTGLGSGDLLDSLSSLASLLQAVGDSLGKDLPFLAAEIPVLNFSVLDVMDVNTSFLASLQEFRQDPNVALDALEATLNEVFGENAADLAWDGAASTLYVAFDIQIIDGGFVQPFAIDLATLLGDELESFLGPEVAEFVGGLVDARGDGAFAVTPQLELGLAFGIDLSSLLAIPDDLATANTELGMLATVAGVTGALQSGRNDLRITRIDRTSGARQSVELRAADATTVDDVVSLIDDAVADAFGDAELGGSGARTSFSFDADQGRFVFSDLDARARDRSSGVDPLLGPDAGEAGLDNGVLRLAGTADLDDLDLEDAYSFDVIVNDTAINVAIEADGARANAADLVAAVDDAFHKATLPRSVISETALPGARLPLSQLIRVSMDGGALVLEATNFPEINGFDPITFGVDGASVAHDIAFSVTEINGSNIARLLGFESDQPLDEAIAQSAPVHAAPESDDRIRVFLDTAATELDFELEAGAPDGLNVVLGLGPIEVNVVGGRALLNAGDGSGDPARIELGFHDIDGDEHDGEFDLSSLGAIAEDPDRSLLELFRLDVAFGLDVAMPMADSLGLFDPATHGFFYTTELITTIEGDSLADLDIANLDDFFGGDLIAFIQDGAFDLDEVELSLPDLGALFSELDVLDIINNPQALLRGLDMIIGTLDQTINELLGSVNLPVIGGHLGSSVTIFQDLRHALIEPALAFASTPNDDGSLPTTVDLIGGFLNDAFNELLGTDDVTYLQAFLDSSGSSSESYLYGVLSFAGEIFSAELDLGFDFGIPGLEMELAEGSALNLSASYDVNLGFGIDRGGFFLLNDTDLSEVSIDFLVDAGAFAGSFSVANLLRVSAFAVESPLGLPANSFAVRPNYGLGERGTVYLEAALEADLFGEQGSEVERDLSGISASKFAGTSNETLIDYEKSVRLSELRLSSLVDLRLTADAELNLQLVGEVLNPITGDPVAIGGAEVVPKVVTELVVLASFDSSRAEMFSLDTMLFNDLRLDASTLYRSFIKPMIDPIRPIIDPISGFLDLLNVTPINFVLDALTAAFPVLKLPLTLADISNDALDFAQSLDDTGGFVLFGTFDFGSKADDLAAGTATSSDLSIDDFSISGSTSTSIGSFGSSSGGLLIRLPLIDDPSNALNLILGRFDQVSLVEAEFSLINLNFTFDLVSDIIGSIGGPQAFADALGGALTARLEARAFMGFTVGYDLGGIVNFIDTLDTLRLLDGIYINSNDGGLIDIYLRAFLQARINLGVVSGGVGGGGEVFFRLGLNDPNDDGRLRIPEMIAIGEYLDETNADFETFLGTVFRGSTGFRLFAEAFASINLLLTSIDFGATIFDFGTSIDFGGLPIGAELVQDLDETDGHAILNVGSRAAANMSNASEDGSETIRISGPASPFELHYTNDGVLQTVTIDENAQSIVIPAGNGANMIDLRGITSEVPTLTFTGDDEDEVWLPSTGFHVVFTGAGDDQIHVEPGSTGTYWIFGETDSDLIEVLGGNALAFGSNDFGLRQTFIGAFMGGGFSQVAAESILASPWGDQQKTLNGFKTTYTRSTQVTADNSADSITLGAGDHTVFAGAGADSIQAAAGAGSVEIYAGAGDDTINAAGMDVMVEAGAGHDLVELGDGINTAWGYGAELGATGETDDQALSALANQDGDDVIIGGADSDSIYGQRGNNILMGGAGADLLHGGRGSDFVTGGVFQITDNTAAPVAVAGLRDGLPGQLVVALLEMADADDSLFSGGGDDLLLGGGGEDRIEGGGGSSLLIGDFGEVDVAANRTIERHRSAGEDSPHAGADTILGGSGSAIQIGGGDAAGGLDTLTAMQGSNLLIGDTADVIGSRILEAPTRITSVPGLRGNTDTITSGGGHDIAIGGEDGDVIDSVAGANMVAGDLADINLVNGRFASIATETSGADVITIGDNGDDAIGDFHPINMIIAGGGGDTIETGRGADAIIADDGEIRFDVQARSTLLSYAPLADGAGDAADRVRDAADRAEIASMVRSLDSEGMTTDGDDTIQAAGGDDLIILGGGNDDIRSGAGADLILGDSGSIDREAGTLVGAVDPFAGSDVIRAGHGDNMVIAGSFDDQATLGDGDNLLIGDTGVISFNPETQALIKMDSRTDVQDGIDTIVAGHGANSAILGGGGDVASFGNGGNRVLGDSGAIRVDDDGSTVIRAKDTTIGGGDTIVTGLGDDYIIGAHGADDLRATGGSNLLAGDSVILRHASAAESHRLLWLRSLDPGEGGNDIVQSGSGDDIALGGAADDVISTGHGSDIAIGDWAALDTPLARSGTGTISASDVLDFGNDRINTAGGNDIAMGGLGDDVIHLGSGGDVGLGDSADITYANLTDLQTLVLTHRAAGGDDQIDAKGAGDSLLVGQAGTDTLEGGDDDDLVIGDLAQFTFLPWDIYNRGESLVERAERLISIRPDLGFNDVIAGGDGRDIVLAGFGDDRVDGQGGQDLIFGDSFDFKRRYLPTFAFDHALERIVVESNHAFTTGGFDELDGGPGPDIMVGHLGPDLFVGNTENDFLAGDTIWLFLEARFSTPDFDADRELRVITVNFPGFGAPDVLSGSQINQAIGAPLESAMRSFVLSTPQDQRTGSALAADYVLPRSAFFEFLSGRAQDLFADLIAMISVPELLERILDTLDYDLDLDLLLEIVRNELEASYAKSGVIDLSPLDRYLMIRLVDEIVRPTIEDILARQQPAADTASWSPADEKGSTAPSTSQSHDQTNRSSAHVH